MMTHAYTVTGMTCSSCEEKIKAQLKKVPGVQAVTTDRQHSMVSITMSSHIDTPVLQQALKEFPKYQLADTGLPSHFAEETSPGKKSWLQTYKPVLLVFSFITGVTLLVQYRNGTFRMFEWMDQFMAAFFLVFSFFKLLDVKAFAESYFSYDIVARKWFGWGYVYPFVELALGVAYLVHFNPLITNTVTLAVMGVSIIGVLRSVMNKRKIRCACLGAVFNLPMSTITIMEDALMIGMSAVMLVSMA